MDWKDCLAWCTGMICVAAAVITLIISMTCYHLRQAEYDAAKSAAEAEARKAGCHCRSVEPPP